jgi:hypothetical protein
LVIPIYREFLASRATTPKKTLQALIAGAFTLNFYFVQGEYMKISHIRFFKYAFATAIVAGLVACAGSSAVVVGKARPAISAEQVKIYSEAPKKFEQIAILESSSQASWAVTAQGKTDVVIARLKEEAAKLGANGVLLQGFGDKSGGSVSTGQTYGNAVYSPAKPGGVGTANGYGTSVGTTIGIMHKGGTGIAIFVDEQ